LAIEGLRRRTDRQTTGGLGNIARAFAHRNYLVYVSGNSISLIGWWLERVAVGWLTWTLTHSGAWLGLISLADFLPVFFLAPFAGVLADRRDRVWTIRLTQWIGCVQASLLAILVVSDAMTIEILFALVLMLGIASGVAQPSRLALIPTLVDRESLASALAINSVIFNLARFIGPALAGIVIAEIGIAAAFAANAVSYIAFQISLLNLRGLPPQLAVGRQNVLRASVEAFSYACRHSGIGPMLLLFVVTTIGTRGFIELFPGFADRVFGRGPQGLAMLTSTVGLGAICGASWMVLRSAITGLANVVLVCTLIMSVAILAFTATDAFYLALPCVFVAGAMMTITGTGAQTLIQAAVDAPHERPGHGALRHDLPRRPGGRHGADGDPERISRVAPRAGARRDRVGQLLAGDAVPAQADGGRAGMLTHGRDRRPSMPARLTLTFEADFFGA
jgi:MFS family permease